MSPTKFQKLSISSMKLNPKQIKHLRTQGHSLSPIVTVADRGLVETVIEAINEALDIHELSRLGP